MRLAVRGRDAVGRHRHVPRLQPFLQLGLGVLAPVVGGGRHDGLAEQARDQRLRRLEAAVDADRADQRLDRVGQDRRPRRAAAARLALGQLQRLGQAQHQRDLVQAVLAHEVGAHAREVAFVGAGEAVEQQPRDGQVQHRVAQELEALVVVGAEAAVRERALEQRALGELVAEPLLDQRRPAGGR